MSKDELKPCPFCGGKVKYLKAGNIPGTPREYADWVMIICPSCGASTAGFADVHELARLWNMRTPVVIEEDGLLCCPNCGAKGSVFLIAAGMYQCGCSSHDDYGCCHVTPGFSRNMDKAIAAWNRRTL